MYCVPGVRLYTGVKIVVMSGEVACCSVRCGTLVGVSVCEYQSVECAFTSPVSIESGW